MKAYRQFREYLERRGFIYVHNPMRDSYIIYDNSRFVKPLLITEISAWDARHNFDRAKDMIEMALVLFGS